MPHQSIQSRRMFIAGSLAAGAVLALPGCATTGAARYEASTAICATTPSSRDLNSDEVRIFPSTLPRLPKYWLSPTAATCWSQNPPGAVMRAKAFWLASTSRRRIASV